MSNSELKRVTFYLDEEAYNMFVKLKGFRMMVKPSDGDKVSDLTNDIVKYFYKNHNPEDEFLKISGKKK